MTSLLYVTEISIKSYTYQLCVLRKKSRSHTVNRTAPLCAPSATQTTFKPKTNTTHVFMSDIINSLSQKYCHSFLSCVPRQQQQQRRCRTTQDCLSPTWATCVLSSVIKYPRARSAKHNSFPSTHQSTNRLSAIVLLASKNSKKLRASPRGV